MEDSTELLIVEEDGSVRAGSDAAKQLAARAGRYRLIADTPGMLVLRPENAHTGGGPRVQMAGEIISRMTVMEVINVIANSNWRGELHVVSDYERVLSFDQGALKSANSDAPDDRLGEILYRLGVIDRRQLDQLLEELPREVRLGERLVEKGLVDRDSLFQHLQSQAEQIFYNALIVTEGHYVFVVPDESDPSAATLHIPVQHLLMQGVQRIDEMALFRERIPSSRMCPEVKPGAGDKKLDATAQTMLAYCDGERSIEDIARLSGLGEFETTKAIYHLMQQGQVVLRAGAKIDEDAARRLLSRFNDVMRDIFMAVATFGGIDRTRETLRQWLHNNGWSEIIGEDVEEDGSVHPDDVIERLRRSEREHPLETLHQGLHEMAAYTLFTVSGTVPRQQELALSRDVNRRLKGLRM